MNSKPASLSSARQALPELHLVNDTDLTALLHLSTPSEIIANLHPTLFEKLLGFSTVTTDIDDAIIAIRSKAGEEVALSKTIPTKDRPLLEWLRALLDEVPSTLRLRFTQAHTEDPDASLPELLTRYPLSTVVLLQQVRFTSLVEACLKSGDLTPLREKTERILSEIRTIPREETDFVGPQASSLMFRGPITTLAIAQWNVGKSLVEAAGAEPFDAIWKIWEGYTRHYVIEGGVAVRCNKTQIPHGFNYVHRHMLAHTPLTHVVYQRIMDACGGKEDRGSGIVLAHGPPGTGKTESMSDFASWIVGHRSCILTCGKPETDLAELVTKLPELVSSLPDHMIILDEFNQLPLEPSSLIDSLRPIATTRSIPIALTGNLNGDLPEGLVGPSSSIETITMTVPPYHLIAEVMLGAEGYSGFESMGRRVTEFLEWAKSSGQISKKPHYDFGMRSLKAITIAAGKILRCMQGAPIYMSEEGAVARAVWSVILARLNPADLTLAEARLSEIFPEAGPSHTLSSADIVAESSPRHQRAVMEAASDPSLQSKLCQLLQISEVRHGMSVLTETPQDTVKRLSIVASLSGIQMVYLGFPEGMDQTEMNVYGGVDPHTKDWVDGTFTQLLRTVQQPDTDGLGSSPEGPKGPAPPRVWLVVEGIQSSLLEGHVNTLLDDNKKLVLSSGEAIRLKENVNVIYVANETFFAECSPATVSRLGMVSLDAAAPGWFW